MVSLVQGSQDNQVQHHPSDHHCRDGEHDAPNERAGPKGQGGGKKPAEHVKGAVRQIDHIHDPEDQGQAGGHQKQNDAKLKSVEKL